MIENMKKYPTDNYKAFLFSGVFQAKNMIEL